MDDVRLALLGDKAAQDRLTERRELLPTTEYSGGISVENTDRKKRAILAFLKDFAALCESVEDSEDSPEYYDLVKKQIRQFRKKYTSLWACPFVAGLRAAVEEDISELKDPRGVQYAVFRLRECVEIMIDRCGWEEKRDDA